MNAENMAIEDLAKYRLPDAYPKKWMYYVGDATPSPTLVEAVKEKTNLQLFHRDEDELADNDEIGKLVGYKEPSVQCQPFLQPRRHFGEGQIHLGTTQEVSHYWQTS